MRVAVVRALAAGALDRAVDVAATLELRGYATRRGSAPARAGRRGRATTPRVLRVGARALGDSRCAAAIARVGGRRALPADDDHDDGGHDRARRRVVVVIAVLPFASRRGVGDA